MNREAPPYLLASLASELAVSRDLPIRWRHGFQESDFNVH